MCFMYLVAAVSSGEPSTRVATAIMAKQKLHKLHQQIIQDRSANTPQQRLMGEKSILHITTLRGYERVGAKISGRSFF